MDNLIVLYIMILDHNFQVSMLRIIFNKVRIVILEDKMKKD
jgi:hypothetical protein